MCHDYLVFVSADSVLCRKKININKQMHSFCSILIFVTKRKNRSDYNNKAYLFMDGWDERFLGCLISIIQFSILF